jgi:hypothetical protein
MNWYFLQKIAQIWAPEKSPAFINEVVRLYKLEYQLSMISKRPFTGQNPRRKENIIKQLEKNLWQAINNVKPIFIKTFGNWLKGHALTDPNMWANELSKRLPGEDDLGEDYYKKNFLGALAGYLQYTYDEYLNSNANSTDNQGYYNSGHKENKTKYNNIYI